MPIFASAVDGNGQKLDGGAMFGNAPRLVWEKWLTPDDKGRVDLACRCLLLEVGDKKILCEAGIGAFFEPKLAERFGVQDATRHALVENLKRQGIEHSDIDYVILSHLHFDHVGGILPTFVELAKEPESLLFPRAKFLVGREAFERSQHPHKRDRASFIPGLADKLVASGRLVIVDGCDFPDSAISSISFRFTEGHTPGQMHTLVSGDHQKILYCGDMVPGTPWLHIPITMGYDRFPEKLIDEKSDLLSEAADEGWLLFYTHDPKVVASKCQWDTGGKIVPTEIVTTMDRLQI